MAVDHVLTSAQRYNTLEVMDPPPSQPFSGDFRATILLILLAMIVFVLEQKRRGELPGLPAMGPCGRMLSQLTPELLGLLVCCTVASVLVDSGVHLGAPIEKADDKVIWAAINSEWPLLQTADTLLAFQAMLRFVLVGSLAARASKQGAMAPFLGTPAAMLLLAATARVALLALSPRDIYHLDGPLGGWMNVALEVAVLPPLMYLTCLARNLKETGGIALAAALLAGGLAAYHHLSLGEPDQRYLDKLFSMEGLCEFFAAVALLVSTLATATSPGQDPSVVAAQPAEDGSVLAAARLAYGLLPLMQLLPAYFMLTAWGAAPFVSIPELVGSGHPFELLQVSVVAEVVAYALAGVVHFALVRGKEEKVPLLSLEV